MSARRRSPPISPSLPLSEDPRGERLQKLLAAAGFGSRRECEQLIVDGRVEVDRQVVTELGTRADPARQEIRVDGSPLPKLKRFYYAVNKPVGVVSTNRDPSGRTRVIDLIGTDQRLFTIGRLDRTSEGLMLVTNDGPLANRLTHPRYEVEKTYRVHVAGHPKPEELEPLKQGVRLAEGVARVASVRIKKRYAKNTDLEIVLKEGLNREIRRLLAKVGHKVLRLKRVAMGPIALGDLPSGAYRTLEPRELRALQRLVQGKQGAKPGAQAPRRSKKKKTVKKKGQHSAARTESRPQGTVLGYEADDGPKERRVKKKTPKKTPKKNAPKKTTRTKGKRRR